MNDDKHDNKKQSARLNMALKVKPYRVTEKVKFSGLKRNQLCFVRA